MLSFSFVSKFLFFFLISSLSFSVIQWFLSSILFSCQVFMFFKVFSCDLFLIAELCDRKNDIISIFLNLQRLALWPSIWSILESVPCALEKNVKSATFE